jgi:hypothetical protein
MYVPFSHPDLPGVLRHSVKLRTLPQDKTLRDRVKKSCWTPSPQTSSLGILGCHLVKSTGNIVNATVTTGGKEEYPRKHHWSMVRAWLTWWCRLHNSVDNDNMLFLEASLEDTIMCTFSSTNNSCRAAAFVYLKRAGKQRLWLAPSGRGSSAHRCEGHVTGGAVYGERSLLQQKFRQWNLEKMRLAMADKFVAQSNAYTCIHFSHRFTLRHQ